MTKQELIEKLLTLHFSEESVVEGLVEKPGPGIHAKRDMVVVEAGKGCTGDHSRKDFWKGERVSGREVTMFAAEVAEALGIDPVVIGDNIICRGLNLSDLKMGDELQIGQVLLRRAEKDHRPCDLFARRVSQEAMEAVRETRMRGALFNVITGGTISNQDPILTR
ncbi:MAG: sulfurase [Bacteroidetes bacterium]|nr:sulfurase [Bacteroidota bacterium]